MVEETKEEVEDTSKSEKNDKIKKILFKKAKPGKKVTFGRKAVREDLTREQGMLKTFFGSGSKMWGTGRSLPQRNGILISGGGLVKSGDKGETGRMFGI